MKKILIVLMLINVNLIAQNKWYEPTKNEVISVFLLTASGVSNGFHEAINYHGYGKGNGFIDIQTSWKNKYKNYDAGDYRERFFLSKSAFVAFTDLNHATAFSNTGFLVSGTAINFSEFKSQWIQYKGWQRAGFIIVRKVFPFMLRSLAFEITYKNL